MEKLLKHCRSPSAYWRSIVSFLSRKNKLSNPLEDLARKILISKNILVLVGAGISVNAGIPDFRSPGGLYNRKDIANVDKIFDINFFLDDPIPFYKLVKEFYTLSTEPTVTHDFLARLFAKGHLSRIYTQNFDGLEERAGLPLDRVVQLHGSLKKAFCTNTFCATEMSISAFKDNLLSDNIPITCSSCGSFVKPNIKFFGEPLDEYVNDRIVEDFPNCDLFIAIGTSMSVTPASQLIDKLLPSTTRVLINKTEVAGKDWDIFLEGDCDTLIKNLELKLWHSPTSSL